jgi:D-serine deaminase-like pyridoxal phosphate-dependent protein
MKSGPWYLLDNEDEVPSPALLVYRERVDENLRRMLAMAGSPDRLRPHVKTHKVPQIVRAQLAQGITKFKCATIAEAEVTAEAGAPDVLLAYQPVGPNIQRLLALADRYASTRFSALVDDDQMLERIGRAFANRGRALELLVDVDVGMHRTGIEPGERARALYAKLESISGVRPGGLHAYDGHLRDADANIRLLQCNQAFEPVAALAQRLARDGLPVPRVVAGGTPTFPFHAQRGSVECSPGTCVYWDWGYSSTLGQPFQHAALVLTRVVSKPGGKRLCLDLGHKGIASENPHPRVMLFSPYSEWALEAAFVGHSEEHLVIDTPEAHLFKVGDCLYGVPWHICPTVALYSEAMIVDDRMIVDRWPIHARARRLTS